MGKNHLNDLPEMGYCILSIKWSPFEGRASWWGPNDSGYTTNINKAGVYTQAQIDERPDYYNDGEATLAIPQSLVLSHSKVIRFADYWGVSTWKERLADRAEKLAKGNDEDGRDSD